MLRRLLYLAPVLALGQAMLDLQERQGDANETDSTDAAVYRRRAMQQMVKLGDYVYLNGGEISTYIQGEQQDDLESSQLASTLSISLKESWDNSTVEFSTIRQRRPPNVNMKPALWADEDGSKIYRWGGASWRDTAKDEDDVKLFVFTPNGDGGGSWDESKPASASDFAALTGNSNGGAASCAGLGFYIGGSVSGSTDPSAKGKKGRWPASPGILTYDMETRGWSNDTTAPLNEPSGAVANIEAHCTTMFRDDKPLVFALGGVRTSAADYSSNEIISMDNITFWDPGEKEWHWQKATGDVPKGREYFCTAGAQGKNGTYEIFIYGGATDIDGTDDKIYLLSLPAFEWFEVDTSSPARMHHTCTTVGKRQMLSVGGVTKAWDWRTEDPWRYAMGVFDMTDLEWKNEYDADADDYESPQMVKDWYNKGGMDNIDWSSDKVREMFGVPATPGSSERGDGQDDSSGSDNAGAIAGGVVGGVVGLALVGVLVWFCYRRQARRSQDSAELTAASVPEYKPSPVNSDSLAVPPYSHSSGSPVFVEGNSPVYQNSSAGYPPQSVYPPSSEYQSSAYAGSAATHHGPSPSYAPDLYPQQQQQRYPVEMPTSGHERAEMEAPDSSVRPELNG